MITACWSSPIPQSLPQSLVASRRFGSAAYRAPSALSRCQPKGAAWLHNFLPYELVLETSEKNKFGTTNKNQIEQIIDEELSPARRPPDTPTIGARHTGTVRLKALVKGVDNPIVLLGKRWRWSKKLLRAWCHWKDLQQ